MAKHVFQPLSVSLARELPSLPHSYWLFLLDWKLPKDLPSPKANDQATKASQSKQNANRYQP